MLRPDHEGTLQPVIDEMLCRRCGECERTCPVVHVPSIRYMRKDSTWVTTGSRVFAAKALDDAIRQHATSGGVVPLLSRQVVEEHGNVFGVICDLPSGRVHFKRVTQIEELDALSGSKYVQADPEQIFREVQTVSQSSRWPVLFVGTPCQIAGLKAFLKHVPDNLYLVELVCHAVPTPLIWQKYLSSVRCPVSHVEFRSKRRGWKTYTMSMRDEQGRELLSHWRGYSFLWGFLSNLFNRLSCHHCAFRCGRSGAHLTVGDFWGVANLFPEMDDNQGISLVIAHDQKGQHLFDSICSLIECRECDFHSAVQSNPALVEDPPCHPSRAQFISAVASGADFEKLIRQTLNMSLSARFTRLVRRMIHV